MTKLSKLVDDLRGATACFSDHDEGSEFPLKVSELLAILDSHDALHMALKLCLARDPSLKNNAMVMAALNTAEAA